MHVLCMVAFLIINQTELLHFLFRSNFGLGLELFEFYPNDHNAIGTFNYFTNQCWKMWSVCVGISVISYMHQYIYKNTVLTIPTTFQDTIQDSC